MTIFSGSNATKLNLRIAPCGHIGIHGDGQAGRHIYIETPGDGKMADLEM